MTQADSSSFDRGSSLAALSSFGSRARPAPGAAQEITGTVDSIRMFGDWGTAMIFDAQLKETKLTGNMVAELKEGQEYVITGSIRHHPKHGQSIEITSARPHVQLNERAIVKFLVANYKGVGEKSAQKFVEGVVTSGGSAGLEAFRQQLLAAPWAIDVAAINKNGSYSTEERDKTTLAYIQRDLATRLVGIDGIRAPVLTGLSKRLAMKLASIKPAPTDPVAAAWAVLAEDPYEAIGLVPGYGFVMADTVGRQVGIPREAPQRLAALVAHAVREGCQNSGHVFLVMSQVRASITKLDSTVSVSAAIDAAKSRSTIATDDEAGPTRVYPYALLKAELSMAKRVADLCERQPALTTDTAEVIGRKIQGAAKRLGGVFKNGVDESQVAALTNILTSKVRLHTLTAEPGSGKTAVMEVLTKVLDHKRFLFCAPTGQGAKVLSNRLRSLGCSASTIHSLLQGSGAGDFKHNEENPLDGDVLVVDEGSMPDLALADAVMRAVNDNMHVIILGDAEQLQSIDPGRVLQDLLEIEEIDHNRLTTVHRNSGALLDVIREVKRGELDTTSRVGVTFSGKLPEVGAGFAEVVAKYIAAVGRSGYAGTGLLMSRKKGEATEPGWNTTYANAVLRETCNPNARKVPGTMIFVNDRIIIKENMKIATELGEEQVVNGDTGTVKGFTLSENDKRNGGAELIVLELDDGRTIPFPGVAGSALQHSYALTVHAAQGSQYNDVITVVTPGHESFINRNMLYTDLSRARTTLDIYGDDQVLRQIAKTPAPARNSGLVGRVRMILEAEEEEEEVCTPVQRQA